MIQKRKFFRRFSSFPNDFFNQMPRRFRSITIRMDSRFFDIIQVIIYKILSDIPQIPLNLLIALINFCKFFPFNICFPKSFFCNIIFFQKPLFIQHNYPLLFSQYLCSHYILSVSILPAKMSAPFLAQTSLLNSLFI